MRNVRWWECALVVLVALAAALYLLEFAPRWPLGRYAAAPAPRDTIYITGAAR